MRHPHVFGDAQVNNADDVRRQWEQQKKKKLSSDKSILDGVPRAIPGLLRAQCIGEKSAKIGFDWSSVAGVRDKVVEELHEFLNTCASPSANRARQEEEFGDLLFSLTQLARKLDFDSEIVMHRAIEKFVRRFKEVERRAGPAISEMGQEKLDVLWEQVKIEEDHL